MKPGRQPLRASSASPIATSLLVVVDVASECSRNRLKTSSRAADELSAVSSRLPFERQKPCASICQRAREYSAFVLHHALVGVAVARVRRRLPEEEHVLRHPDAHARAVLALLRPAEPIGLVVLAHDVGDDRDHPEVGEAVALVVEDRVGVERARRLEPEAVHPARPDPVLHVHRHHAARLEHAEQLRRQEVHLPPEVRVVVGVPEVVVARRVLVLRAERDRS
jgi:hypothetical protein